MSAITTHVLDMAKGLPAAGLPVLLEYLAGAEWTPVGTGVTDDDGRCRDLMFADRHLEPGQYRITFDTGRYFAEQAAFYPSVIVMFVVPDSAVHYHVPLLLSPYGYSTYRGS